MTFKTLFKRLIVLLFLFGFVQTVRAHEPTPHAIGVAILNSGNSGPQREYTLDGSNSNDPSGSIISYQWQVVDVTTTVSNPPADFPFYYDISSSHGQQVSATFTTPWSDEQVIYQVRLTVYSMNKNYTHPFVDTYNVYAYGTCDGPDCERYNN